MIPRSRRPPCLTMISPPRSERTLFFRYTPRTWSASLREIAPRHERLQEGLLTLHDLHGHVAEARTHSGDGLVMLARDRPSKSGRDRPRLGDFENRGGLVDLKSTAPLVG